MAAVTATWSDGRTEERPTLEPDLGLACDFALRWAPETFPFITIASIFPGGAPRAHVACSAGLSPSAAVARVQIGPRKPLLHGQRACQGNAQRQAEEDEHWAALRRLGRS
jgi:hypothetical protein